MSGRLLLLLMLVPFHSSYGQRLSAREGTYFEIGAGAARLTERICGSCIPLRGDRSLSPQASYIHQLGSERRFSLVMIGVSLRLF
jgi:hypothetical protein